MQRLGVLPGSSHVQRQSGGERGGSVQDHKERVKDNRACVRRWQHGEQLRITIAGADRNEGTNAVESAVRFGELLRLCAAAGVKDVRLLLCGPGVSDTWESGTLVLPPEPAWNTDPTQPAPSLSLDSHAHNQRTTTTAGAAAAATAKEQSRPLAEALAQPFTNAPFPALHVAGRQQQQEQRQQQQQQHMASPVQRAGSGTPFLTSVLCQPHRSAGMSETSGDERARAHVDSADEGEEVVAVRAMQQQAQQLTRAKVTQQQQAQLAPQQQQQQRAHIELRRAASTQSLMGGSRGVGGSGGVGRRRLMQAQQQQEQRAAMQQQQRQEQHHAKFRRAATTQALLSNGIGSKEEGSAPAPFQPPQQQQQQQPSNQKQQQDCFQPQLSEQQQQQQQQANVHREDCMRRVSSMQALVGWGGGRSRPKRVLGERRQSVGGQVDQGLSSALNGDNLGSQQQEQQQQQGEQHLELQQAGSSQSLGSRRGSRAKLAQQQQLEQGEQHTELQRAASSQSLGSRRGSRAKLAQQQQQQQQQQQVQEQHGFVGSFAHPESLTTPTGDMQGCQSVKRDDSSSPAEGDRVTPMPSPQTKTAAAGPAGAAQCGMVVRVAYAHGKLHEIMDMHSEHLRQRMKALELQRRQQQKQQQKQQQQLTEQQQPGKQQQACPVKEAATGAADLQDLDTPEQPPHLVACFNASVWGYGFSWTRTLQYATHELRCPVILTACSTEEAEEDEETIDEAGLKGCMLWGAERNPYGSMRYWRAMEAGTPAPAPAPALQQQQRQQQELEQVPQVEACAPVEAASPSDMQCQSTSPSRYSVVKIPLVAKGMLCTEYGSSGSSSSSSSDGEEVWPASNQAWLCMGPPAP